MTEAYLQSLGFSSTHSEHGSRGPAFEVAWRYQHAHLAHDGAALFIEHPLGMPRCRLSALAAPLAAQDVFASIGLHDRPALEAAIRDFYAAHGGMGAAVKPDVPFVYRPFRRLP